MQYVVVSFRREDKYAQTVKKNGERADTKKRTKEKDPAEETGRKTVGRARRNQAAHGNKPRSCGNGATPALGNAA